MSGFESPPPTSTDYFNSLFYYDPTANGGTGGGGSTVPSVNYPVAQGLVSFPDGINLANDLVFTATTTENNDIVGANSIQCLGLTLKAGSGSSNTVSMNADATTNSLLTVNGNLKCGNGSLVATNIYSATGSTSNSINMLTSLSGNTSNKTGLGVYYNLNSTGEVDLVGMGNTSGGGFSFYQSNASTLTNIMGITSNGVNIVAGGNPTLLSTNTYGLVSSQGITIKNGATNSVLIYADGTSNNQLDISGNAYATNVSISTTQAYPLANSQNLSTISYVNGAIASLPSIAGVITGTIVMYTGTTQPAGYLFCNGSQKSTTTYAALYAVIGDLYATGSITAGNFYLPNLQNNMPVGSQSSALNGVVVSGGASGGVYPPQIYGGNSTIAVNQLAPHSHSITNNVGGATWQVNQTPNTSVGGTALRLVSASAYNLANTTDTQNNFGTNQSQAQFYPPFCAVNFIIKT
jgi:microcystin-dependent protein